MFSFKSVTINPYLAYDTEENKNRVLEILDDNEFVKKTIFGVFGDFAKGEAILQMEPVSLMSPGDKTSVYIQIVIEGELVHKVRWYQNNQDKIFDGLSDWFSEIEDLELSVLITLVPSPLKCGPAVATIGIG